MNIFNIIKKGIFLFVLWISCTSLSQAAHEVVIETTGIAAGHTLKARDEAINRAMRSAIEQGVGSVIDSETMVQNYQLLDDQVYSHVKGYIKDYEIINEEQVPDNTTRITIRANVALGLLEKDIKALKITWKRRGNPRTMFLFTELVDGLEQAGAVTQTTFGTQFLRF